MSDVEYKNDIMDELLSDSQIHGYIRQKELDDLLDVIHNPFFNDTTIYDYSIKLEPQKKELPKKKRKSRQTKRKTTHYLTKNTFDDLGRAKMDIRKHLPEPYRSQISKTKIVNQALEMILQEFHLNGEKSNLMKTILQSLGTK